MRFGSLSGWVAVLGGSLAAVGLTVASAMAAGPAVADAALTPQAISFTSTPPASPGVGGSYTVTATGGGSGNPVTFSVDPGSRACTISGATISFTAAGTCVVTANQAAAPGYSAAPRVRQKIKVAPGAVTPMGAVGLLGLALAAGVSLYLVQRRRFRAAPIGL